MAPGPIPSLPLRETHRSPGVVLPLTMQDFTIQEHERGVKDIVTLRLITMSHSSRLNLILAYITSIADEAR